MRLKNLKKIIISAAISAALIPQIAKAAEANYRFDLTAARSGGFVGFLQDNTSVNLGKPPTTDRAGRIVADQNGRKNYNTPAISYKAESKAARFAATTLAEPTPQTLAINSNFQSQWVAKIFGIGIGATGLMHADINNDGSEELIFASDTDDGAGFGPANSLSIMAYNKAKKTWSIIQQKHYTGSHITALYTYRNAATNASMAAFATLDNADNAVLNVLNLTTNTTVAKIAVGTNSGAVNEILMGDADNDGANELVAVSAASSYFYNISDYSPSGYIPYGAAHAAIGNVDADTQIELVYANGKVLSVKNNAVKQKWNYSLGFGHFVRLADIDGDKRAEIISADSWYFVRALDADRKSVKWEHPADLDIDALRIADINNDGKADILYGDGQWGSLHALDANGNEFWSLTNPDDGVTDIAVFDANADGKLDVAWGAGYSDTGPDYLHINNISSKQNLFQSPAIDPPFRTVAFGDADNDGKKDFITMTRTSESGYSDAIITVLNADTGALEWQSKSGLFGGLTWVGGLAAAVGDVDNDGKNELVVVGDKLYDGAIYVVDVKKKKLKKTIILDSGSPLYAVKIADVDGDGHSDIIAGGGKAHTGSPGTYVYVVNGATGEVKWHSHNLSSDWNGVYGLDIADIDGNGHLDILVSLDRLFVFDGMTHENWMTEKSDYSGITIQPTSGSSAATVIAGDSTGMLQVLTGDLLTPQASYHVCSSAIGAVERLTEQKILFTCGSKLRMLDLASNKAQYIFTIAEGVETDSLVVTDVNGGLKIGLGATYSRLLRYLPSAE